MQKLIDHVENLLLCYLVVESLEKLVHGPEVGFDLLLGVLVHAQLHLGGLAAVHEAFDLGKVAHGTIVVVGEDLVLQAGGKILSNLVAALKNLLVAITKPGAGHLNGELIQISNEKNGTLVCNLCHCNLLSQDSLRAHIQSHMMKKDVFFKEGMSKIQIVYQKHPHASSSVLDFSFAVDRSNFLHVESWGICACKLLVEFFHMIINTYMSPV